MAQGRRRAGTRANRRLPFSGATGHGYGHGHGHGEVDTSVVDSDQVVARRVRVVVAALLAPLILAALVAMVVLWPDGPVTIKDAQQESARGVVTVLKPCPETPEDCDQATVRLTAGRDKGQLAPIEVPKGEQSRIPVEVGDKILLGVQQTAKTIADRYQFVDHDRTGPLLILVGIFAVAVVALSRWRGVTALLALGVTAVLLTKFVLPAILKGTNPLLVAVVGGAVIMVVALFLTHGVNAQSAIALSGTVAALGLTVLLSWFFTAFTQLSGLADDKASAVLAYVPDLDLAGLLAAGMVIGTLGVLDDVTVTQAAAVWELSAANPAASRSELFAGGLRVGRAHVASVVNTLVLAYAGAALPVLMTFAISGLPGRDVVSTELVAMEVVRGLVGSLGIILAVPLTTALAAMAVADRSQGTASSEGGAGTSQGA